MSINKTSSPSPEYMGDSPSPTSVEQRVTQDDWEGIYKDYGGGIKVGQPFVDRYGINENARKMCPDCNTSMIKTPSGYFCIWCHLKVEADETDTGPIGYSPAGSESGEAHRKDPEIPEGQDGAWWSVVNQGY